MHGTDSRQIIRNSQAVSKGAIREGTIIEVHVKQPGGEDICTNVKISQSDLELFEEIKNVR